MAASVLRAQSSVSRFPVPGEFTLSPSGSMPIGSVLPSDTATVRRQSSLQGTAGGGGGGGDSVQLHDGDAISLAPSADSIVFRSTSRPSKLDYTRSIAKSGGAGSSLRVFQTVKAAAVGAYGCATVLLYPHRRSVSLPCLCVTSRTRVIC